MLTKGAIGNLINRYRAVLKKCNLMNVFGSLAVAGILVMGAGVARATDYNVHITGKETSYPDTIKTGDNNEYTYSFSKRDTLSCPIKAEAEKNAAVYLGYSTNNTNSVTIHNLDINISDINDASAVGLWISGGSDKKITFDNGNLTIAGQIKNYNFPEDYKGTGNYTGIQALGNNNGCVQFYG